MAFIVFTIFFITTGLATLYRFKYGFYFFFFSYFAYPEILALGIGEDGFALSMSRAILLVFSLIIPLRILLLIEDRRYLWGLIRQRKDFIIIGAVLYFWKVLCTLIKSGIQANTLSGLVNDFLIFFTLTFTILLSIRRRSDLIVLLYVLLSALTVTELIGFYEIIYEESLFKNVEYSFTFSSDLSQLLFRGDKVRIQSVYSNSIVLGFALSLCFPLLYFCARRLKTMRVLSIIVLLIMPVTIFYTRSRGSLITFLFLGLLIIINLFNNRLTTSFRDQRILSLLFFLLITVIPILFAEPIFALINVLVGEGNVSLTEDSSANTRFGQFLVFLDLPIDSLIFGFGRVRYLLDTLDEMLALDSFYIRTTLEAGIPGVLLLIAYQITSLSYSFNLLKRVWKNSFYRLLVGTICLTLFALLLIFNLTSTSYFSFFLFGYPALLLTIDHIFSNQQKSKTSYSHEHIINK